MNDQYVQIIKNALDIKDERIQSGKLDFHSETFTDPIQALDYFKEFKGEGWLCATDQSQIQVFPDSSTWVVYIPLGS